MYPYGSGMPNASPSQNPSMYPQNMPFGAGFQVPQQNQSPYPNPAAGGSPYPPQGQYQSNAPYPSSNSYSSGAPYPPSNAPYPSSNAPYPSNNPYPTSTPYPSNNPPYTPSNSYTSNASYPPAGGAAYPTPPFGAGFQSSQQSNQSYPQSNQSYPQSNPYPPSSTNIGYPQQQSGPNGSAPHYPTQSFGQHNYAQTQQYPGNYSNNSNQVFGSSSSAPASSTRQKGTPTLIPPSDFDADRDCQALRKAMKGFGTDEDGIIDVICRRSNAQRQMIQQRFKTLFGKELISDIKSETSGNFETLLVALLRPIVEYYCIELCEAMVGVGTDEDALIETLCTLSNSEILIIKQNYTRLYGRQLESDLIGEASGHFKRLLVSLCNAARDESGQTDVAAAQNDARELLRAGELRVGTDESTFNCILCSRNYGQLRLIFEEYEKLTGHSFEKAIKKEFSGDIEDGLLAIYRCVTNKAEFFASRLHRSMAGMGTNDRQLIRLIVTRCEIDMQDIKQAFESKYGKSLKSWIKGDTSGHYKHALYALIGEQKS